MREKSLFFFIRKHSIAPLPHFDPAECAYYYSNELGAYTAQRICEQFDQFMHDRVLRKELRKLVFSLPGTRVVLVGFGYTVPFMETFKRNFYEITRQRDEYGEPYSTVSYSSVSLIPPRTNNTKYVDGSFLARRSGAVHSRTRLVGVHETKWPFSDHSLPFVFIMHGFEGMNNPEGILDETYRVLVPHGELWIVVPHPWTLWSRSPRFLMNGQRHYEVSEMITILENRGFYIRGFEPFGAYPQWWGGDKPLRSRTGEIARRWPHGDFLDFIAKRIFPVLGGMFLIRATITKPKRWQDRIKEYCLENQ